MIYRLDEFTENSINPITNTPYDDSWVVFILTESKDYNKFVGGQNGCTYTIKFSRFANKDWRLALCDFIDYNEDNNKNIILVLKSDELDEARKIYKNHNYKETTLRAGEPKFLVHSTTAESFATIKKDAMLKSFNRLKLCGEPIGLKLGDPKDFSDYIMFCGGGVTGEIVVNSKQKGEIIMDINSEYSPGVRLYFDAAKIAKDGLLIRDGCHLKVKSELPLSPYLMFTATPDSIGLGKHISTPKEFSEKADEYFNKINNPTFLKIRDENTISDFKKLMLLYAPELDKHQNRTTPTEIIVKWTDSIIKQQDDTDRLLEVCYVDEKAVGFVYGKIDRPHHKGYIRPNWGYVMEFFVLPEYRRYGIGKKMFSRLEKYFKSNGTEGIYLTSDPVTGKPFWEALGFNTTGEFSNENGQEVFEKSW